MFSSAKQNLPYYSHHLKAYGFEVKKMLGSGAFADVVLGLQNGQQYAVKCIKKKLVNEKPELFTYIKNEFQIVKVLQHPNIIKQFGIIQNEEFYLIVLQYCNIGNLLNYQSNLPSRRFAVRQTKEIISKLIKGLKNIHQQGFIHRDIKPQNILIKKDHGKFLFKIGDFGFARPIENNARTYCGTTNYMAPQILADKPYTVSVDYWSLGVLMYFMLFGQLPFKGIDILSEIKKKCKSGFDYKKSLTHDVSIEQNQEDLVQDFFEKLFVIDEKKRMGIIQIMDHPFFSGYFNQEKLKLKKITSRKSTEDSEEQNPYKEQKKEIQLQIQKIDLLRQSANLFYDVNQVNLQEWQALSLKYYLLKAYIFYSNCLINQLANETENPENLKQGKWKDFIKSQNAINYLKLIRQNLKVVRMDFKLIYGKLINNMSSIPIKQITVSLTEDIQQKSFEDFKGSYRAVISHIYKLIHEKKNLAGTVQQQLRMRLFCCHLINRIFETKTLNINLSYYFNWKKKYESENIKSFDITTFKKWLAAQNKQNLERNINILFDRYMSNK